MPLLRAKELAYPLAKAKIALALCDARLADEMEKAKAQSADLKRVVYWGNAETRSADEQARLREFHRLRHRKRRRLPDRLHLRHHRRAEGHDAFPPRHAGDLRQLRQACAARRAVRPLHRLAAARLHLRPRRPRAVSAPHRRIDRAAGAGRARPTPRRDRRSTRSPFRSPRRPPIARCSASSRTSTSPRCANACRPARRCPRPPSRPGTRRPASRSSTASARPRCCTSSSARPSSEVRAGLDRQAGAGLRGAHPRRRRQCREARHGRPPCGSWSHRLPLSRRRPPEEIRAERLERHRRHLPDGCGRLLLVPGALRRHDHLGGLQHRRPRGGSSPADACRGRRMRRGRLPRRGARPDRQGLCRAARGHHGRRRDGQGAAGSREGDGRALQISARRRVRHRTAEDPDRKTAALRIAEDGRGRALRSKLAS